MRLTLRTLLAYRDGVLSPADHAELHRRIQQHPDAGILLRRIEELVSSSNVLAPTLDAAGLSSANVIAEYLDDSLTSSKVAELERLCLQHSEHLCELAHCHRLLAEAMNTHVAVPARLRKMALALADPARRASPHTSLLVDPGKLDAATTPQPNLTSPTSDPSRASDSAENAPPLQVGFESPMMASSGAKIKQVGLSLETNSLTREVPEYLVGSRRRRWQTPLTGSALLLLLVLLVWQSIGPFDDLRSLWVAQSTDVLPPAPKRTDPADQQAITTDQLPPAEDASPPTSELDSPPGSPPPVQTPPAAEASDDAEAQQPADHQTQAPVASQPRPTDTAGPSTSEVSPAAPAPSDAELADTPASEPRQQPLLRWIPADETQQRATILVQSDREDWRLLDQNPIAIDHSHLLIPPAARTTIEFADWQVTLCGPGSAQLGLQDGHAELRTPLFRGLLSCPSEPAPLLLDTPLGRFELLLLDPTAWLAIEVTHRPVARGSILEEDTYVPMLIIVLGMTAPNVDGDLAVVHSVELGRNLTLNQPGQGVAVSLPPELVQFSLHNPPRWYSARSLRQIDQLAMSDLRGLLQSSTSQLSIQRLRDIATDRRPEVAALAIQLALMKGDWQPFATELLTADRMRAHWSPTLELARQVLLAQPAAVAGLREAMTAAFGADAQRLVDILAGISRPQLDKDGLGGLLGGLDADNLALRVLSAFELTELTGNDSGYLPHAPVRATIGQLRQQHNAGRLQPLPISDPIWERTARP